MSLAGELRTIDLFDLLAWIMGRRKSGFMQLSRRSTRKRLGFRDGVLHTSNSNDPRETIGQTLVRDGVISEETLFRALLRQEQEKRRLGEILTAEGLVSEQQLTHMLRANAEAHLHDLFLWPDGRFEFDDGQMPPESPSDLRVELGALLEEGRHRRERWAQLRQRFPSSEVTFRLIADPVSVVDPGLRRITDLAAWGKTLAAISLETRRSEYETSLLVAGLCDQGVLAVDRIEQGAPETDPVGTIATQLATAEARLKGGRFDKALEAYERVLALDGVNQAAKKGLLAVAEARQLDKLKRKVPLDKVPSLRITAVSLAQQRFSPDEGFVLSRINGQWDVRSILKLCPMAEEDTLTIFALLLERQVIELR
jgi:hypothetical protein